MISLQIIQAAAAQAKTVHSVRVTYMAQDPVGQAETISWEINRKLKQAFLFYRTVW
jgi:hypothetical protein